MENASHDNLMNKYLTAPQFTPLLLRYMLCTALTKEHASIAEPVDVTQSTDVVTLKGCLDSLGLSNDVQHKKKNMYTLICGGSSCALGLLLPVAAALGRNCLFLADEQLLGDSVEDVLRTLKVHGIRHEFISRRSMRIWGKLTAGTFLISGSCDGWFLSGLLYALPLLRENSVVMVEGTLECEGEILVTLKVLKDAGVNIISHINSNPESKLDGKNRSHVGASFRILGGQEYSLNAIPELIGS